LYHKWRSWIPINALLERTYLSASRGGFVGTLKRCLQSYAEMVGIDVSERVLKDAQSSCSEESTHFIRMDAEHLGVRDERR
jgi:ubiquinone/menaquinone biosynthesis C-methylase UbiE